MNENRERLRRLLLLVPYVAKRQGVTVTELAKKLGVERQELLEDLDLLAMVGRPPFSPDDFIDIYVEDDKVHVALDQRFTRPPRLTAAEAAALWAAAQTLKPAARSALGSAQKKLLQGVPPSAQKMFKGLANRVGAEAAPMDDVLEPLARAAREGREVEFDYLAAGRRKGERRAVRPFAVYVQLGHWYLKGHDVGRDGERSFRVDRVSKLEVTARRFTPPADVDTSQSTLTGTKTVVRFSKVAAPWASEQFPDARKVEGGGVEATLTSAGKDWLVPFVMSFGGEAEVVEPAELREAVRETAAAMRARLK